jgi:hypothetical protein
MQIVRIAGMPAAKRAFQFSPRDILGVCREFRFGKRGIL